VEAVIFIGLQATGKSTFYAQRFMRSHVRINLDMLHTRRKEAILLDACLNMPHSFVVDNTNPTREERAGYIRRSRKKGFRIVGYYFSSVVSQALDRNAMRPENERVPDAGIRSVHSRLQLPDYSEGFDGLFHVSIASDNSFVVSDWKTENEVRRS